jgi:hypothetical protein
VWKIPLAWSLALVLRSAGALPDLLQQLAVFREEQNPVVAVAVGHDDVAVVQDGDARR